MPDPVARPLTAEEEADWRGWLAGGHMPFGTDAMQGDRIARLLATLDQVREATVQGDGPRLDRETLAKAMHPFWFEDVAALHPPDTMTPREWGELVGNVHQRREDALKEADAILERWPVAAPVVTAPRDAELRAALVAITERCWDTNDECRWCDNDMDDGHSMDCAAQIAAAALGDSRPPGEDAG